MKWILAIAVLIAGSMLGTIVSATVRRVLSRPERPERVKTLAAAAASIVFSAVLAVTVVASLSLIDKTAVQKLPDSLINAVPRFLVALVLVLVGNALASIVGNVVGSAVLKATGRPQPRVVGLVRGVTLGVFVLMAIGQIGVNTRIVDMAVAGIIFSVSLSVALLTGLGGRTMAGHVAAGRYVNRIVKPGDRIAGDGFEGTVKAVWGATVELDTPDAGVTHVPHATILGGNLRIERGPEA